MLMGQTLHEWNLLSDEDKGESMHKRQQLFAVVLTLGAGSWDFVTRHRKTNKELSIC